MTSHSLGNVFDAMMEKGQDQIPDEGFLTKMPMYFIVTVDKILLCLGVLLLADPNLNPKINPNHNFNPKSNPNLNPSPNLNPYPILNPNP